MEVYIGSDHRGFEMKQQLVLWLQEEGYVVHDLGANTSDASDYPDWGFAVAQEVVQDPERRGIVLCGSGVGIAIAANKVKGARAALVHDPDIALNARQDDDLNILALGASYITLEDAKHVISTWLSTPFSKEERHIQRLKKIEAYERHNS